MGRFDGYLIGTDFDGTFALPGAALSPVNLAAVARFQAEGGRFTIASGRPPEFIRQQCASFMVNAPIIAMNGTMIFDESDFHLMHSVTLDRAVLAVLDEIVTSGFCRSMSLWNNGGDREAQRWTRESGLLPSERFQSLTQPWYKAVLVQERDETLSLRDWFNERYADRYAGSRSWPEGFEIQPLASGKGEALLWIREHLGSAARVTIGVGDYENDLSLIRCADIGVAVGNALDEVKQAADRVTVPNSEHAIAAIIEALEREGW